jgi:GH15 family glucan-1,4-alpha-glucosidase
LVELQPPENLETLTNQTLKDSLPAYLHNNNGIPVPANRSGARAPLEAQLLSYEALLDYADLVDLSNPNKADFLRKSANELRNNVLERFVVRKNDGSAMWPQTFLTAMLDLDPANGTVRQLNTHMSDAAEGLMGRFFKGDDPAIVELRQAITRTITSGDFLTDGGIRCRALSDHGVFDFAEYHGAFANWVILTHTVAKGQLAQEYARVAAELWTRMLCSIVVSGTF